jgi:ubiquinone/menaquinone biosynthesis C-methylase UbiE
LSKKLLYSAPRVIRLEIADVFKKALGEKYLEVVNSSLRVLDAGCGTGLAG